MAGASVKLQCGVGDLRVGLGLGRSRLDQQRGDQGTHPGGCGEDVERDLEAVRERGAAQRTDPAWEST
jgi:hypothetical protein